MATSLYGDVGIHLWFLLNMVTDHFWRARLVVSVVSARERAVDNFIQGTKTWADHLL